MALSAGGEPQEAMEFELTAERQRTEHQLASAKLQLQIRLGEGCYSGAALPAGGRRERRATRNVIHDHHDEAVADDVRRRHASVQEPVDGGEVRDGAGYGYAREHG